MNEIERSTLVPWISSARRQFNLKEQQDSKSKQKIRKWKTQNFWQIRGFGTFASRSFEFSFPSLQFLWHSFGATEAHLNPLCYLKKSSLHAWVKTFTKQLQICQFDINCQFDVLIWLNCLLFLQFKWNLRRFRFANADGHVQQTPENPSTSQTCSNR